MIALPFSSPIWGGSKVINASRFHAMTNASRGVAACPLPADSSSTANATAARNARVISSPQFRDVNYAFNFQAMPAFAYHDPLPEQRDRAQAPAWERMTGT